ncbi:Alpha/Beta hydrolase protein [Phakopsora pachyrhizi]|uniref:Alpha/Beta hydrolase protein n=1 Tax=Phakopsora pachyrhizi TaxID=170000 RepID=A0AAV0BT32_PHAPC|nr:Alpha/Beta hydrolase protein [Phakopsora pachyrhizi]
MRWCSLQNTCKVVFLICLLSPQFFAIPAPGENSQAENVIPPPPQLPAGAVVNATQNVTTGPPQPQSNASHSPGPSNATQGPKLDVPSAIANQSLPSNASLPSVNSTRSPATPTNGTTGSGNFSVSANSSALQGLPASKDPVIEAGLIQFNSNSSVAFYVPGKKIPFVTWNVGPSYAGLLSVSPQTLGANMTSAANSTASNATNQTTGSTNSSSLAPPSAVPGAPISNSTATTNLGNSTATTSSASSKKVFFWFFPATAPEGTKKLTLWVNGGRGCSSMAGALTESGPISWKNGQVAPSKNIYSWTNSSSILYIEHYRGYSTSSSKSVDSLAEEIVGFLKNWYQVFPEMSPMKLYLTGEAYAGLTVPYLADYILSHPSSVPSKLNGLLFFNPVFTYDAVQMQVPAFPFVKANQQLFRLNDTTMARLSKLHEGCGYQEYLQKYLTFPPANVTFPAPQTSLYDVDGNKNATCDIWHHAYRAAKEVNPSFNPYLISQNNPLPYSALNLPASISQKIPGQEGDAVYFNRTEVKKLLHVPVSSNWSTCTSPREVIPTDPELTTTSSSIAVLGRVATKLKRTVIAHGSLDFRVITNGTLLALQNTTWGGTQGFQTSINSSFIVADQGTLGKYITERNLSFVELVGSGESVPESEPKASLQIFRYLIGELKAISNTTEKLASETLANSTSNFPGNSTSFLAPPPPRSESLPSTPATTADVPKNSTGPSDNHSNLTSPPAVNSTAVSNNTSPSGDKAAPAGSHGPADRPAQTAAH